MSDKLYELMESYLPKDKESIQRQYLFSELELWTMWNILWPEPDLISRAFTVIKQQHTQWEIDWLNTLMTQTDVWSIQGKRESITCHWSSLSVDASKMP